MQKLLYIFLAIILISPSLAEESRPHLSQDENINEARKLLEKKRFQEVLLILRPRLIPSRPDITDIRFLFGLAAVGAAIEADKKQKDALLIEAITAFRAILVNRPELVRVRLELARAFFIKGDDTLAKKHFVLVLGGNPPRAMAINIHRFLGEIQSRKRWSGYISIGVDNNDNINNGTDTEVIYVPIFGGEPLPFVLDESSRPREERALIFSGGGTYQYPLGKNLRWRFGADASHSEYSGSELDQHFLSFRTGPRWLISPQSEFSVSAFGGQRWVSKNRHSQEFGLRVNSSYKITPKAGINSSWSLKETHPRINPGNNGNSIEVNYSLGGNYLFSSILQGNIGISGGETRPSRSHIKGFNMGFGAILPKGWTVGGSASWSRTSHKINAPLTFPPERFIERGRNFRLFTLNRGFTIFNFSPRISIVRELIESNDIRGDYQRTRWNVNFVRQF